MQNRIVGNGKLLNENGDLNACGYATELLLDYSRNDIKASKLRIKEWDYYLVYNDDFAVAMTIDDNSYMGLVSASLIDFKARTETTKSMMSFLPKGKTNLPSSSKRGDTVFESKKAKLSFKFEGKNRKLTAHLKQFKDKKDLFIDIELSDEPVDSMVIATPFEKEKYFYYNQKIVGMKASGKVVFGDQTLNFEPQNSLGILDWGRGVWTYKNTWYWGAGCGYVGDKIFGFNIGYGFGNTTAASENMLFFDGVAHKLEEVNFNIPKNGKGKEDFLKQWTFTSSDKRFEMTFEPIINRKSSTSVGVICSDQNQVFGLFNGQVVLDSGEVIEIKNFLGFAEKVFNKW